MKNYIILLFSLTIILTSCKKENIKLTNPDKDTPKFVGIWSRVYPILGSDFTAKYAIDTNQINYSNKGNGPGNADYRIQFDSYDEKDKRWIGHTSENQYYLIFFKNITDEHITIYKQKVADPNDAQNIPIPSNSNTEHYGWNTYSK